MFFIVPDPEDKAGQDAPGDNKAPSFKVELDLDDAPFLEEPLEEAPPEQVTIPVPVEQPKDNEEQPTRLELLLARLKANKKKLILAGGAFVFLLVAFIMVNKFIFGAPPKPQPAGPRQVTVQTQPTEDDPNAPPVYVVNWDPFLVELRGSEGEVRFLYCQFSTPTTDPVLYAELQAKKIALRDAIYYYLKNKPLAFLSDSTRQGALKEDIISVINEHVSSAKVSELYFEEYVVRGS